MLSQFPKIDDQSELPVYRQLYIGLRDGILAGVLRDGERLPPTREMAQHMGLNRATVSAAYALLEQEGLISGQVGRGSFVQYQGGPPTKEISFATSRPAEELFPLEEIRTLTTEVMRHSAAAVLQLGSPFGYEPLRQYLMEQAAAEGVFDPEEDDLLITSGCQQALDLIRKALMEPGETAVVEEPVYPGLKNAFEGRLSLSGTSIKFVTPSFRNPTGYTMTLAERYQLAQGQERLLVEIDIYSRLRYTGDPLPAVRALGCRHRCLLLRSFSKIAFPGLRVGWLIGPRPLVAKLAAAKQWTDLHSDQLSQAILLEFARTGGLDRHLARVLAAGRERLRSIVETLEAVLPPGSRFTRPEGGMNLWVTLPEGCDAAALLEKARRAGVTFLPGRYFGLESGFTESLRLSFAGLSPGRITEGLRRLEPLFSEEARIAARMKEPAPEMAMV